LLVIPNQRVWKYFHKIENISTSKNGNQQYFEQQAKMENKLFLIQKWNKKKA